MHRGARRFISLLLLAGVFAWLSPAAVLAAGQPTRAVDGARAQYGPVAQGESLSAVASNIIQQYPDYTLHQLMVALYAGNPAAFVDGDIRRLQPGAMLKLPDTEGLRENSAESARQLFQKLMRDADKAVAPPAEDTRKLKFPIWLSWFLTNLAAITLFGIGSLIWRIKHPAARGEAGAQELQEPENILNEMAGSNHRRVPKAFLRGESSGSGSGSESANEPDAKFDASRPSEAELDILLDMANAYVEIVRLQEAKKILQRVLEFGSEYQHFEARQVMKEIEAWG